MLAAHNRVTPDSRFVSILPMSFIGGLLLALLPAAASSCRRPSTSATPSAFGSR